MASQPSGQMPLVSHRAAHMSSWAQHTGGARPLLACYHTNLEAGVDLTSYTLRSYCVFAVTCLSSSSTNTSTSASKPHYQSHLLGAVVA